jgi:hypothetical protein
MSEEAYRRVTYDMTLQAARTLAARSPRMTFVYVSGAAADSTGQGRIMWARVKGQTENALFRRACSRTATSTPRHSAEPAPGERDARPTPVGAAYFR